MDVKCLGGSHDGGCRLAAAVARSQNLRISALGHVTVSSDVSEQQLVSVHPSPVLTHTLTVIVVRSSRIPRTAPIEMAENTQIDILMDPRYPSAVQTNVQNTRVGCVTRDRFVCMIDDNENKHMLSDEGMKEETVFGSENDPQPLAVDLAINETGLGRSSDTAADVSEDSEDEEDEQEHSRYDACIDTVDAYEHISTALLPYRV